MANVIRPSPVEAASDVLKERFSDATVIFVAGSVLRGEGTPYSDLDLVVIYEKLPAAFNESFVHQGWPVEAFVHDPETLNYFFWERDRPSGMPTLATMVIEGKEIPAQGELSKLCRGLAQTVIEAGPPEWTETNIQQARYAITDLCDDIRTPRNNAELTASATLLFELLADFYFRSMSRWSAKGKSVPRKLAKADSTLAQRFTGAFDSAFSNHDSSEILQLAESLLVPYGGFLSENYKRDAPANWRKTLPTA